MKLAHRHAIDDRKILVFDRFLRSAEVRAFAQSLHDIEFRRGERDTGRSGVQTPSFSRDYDVGVVENKPFVKRIRALVGEHFASLQEPKLYRAYANLGLFGDMHVAHRDSPRTHESVTALFYANDTWEWTWAGETVFFNESHDSLVAVNPRPGRLVLFDGTLLHRTGSVSRTCQASRFTVAIKFHSGRARG